MTINSKVYDKFLLGYMIKLTNKAAKLYTGDIDELAFLFIRDIKAQHLINHETSKVAEKEKLDLLDQFIENSRKKGEYFYLASSHDDCAKDHKDWQGKLYVDANAPKEVIEYARARGLYTIQWVMDAPVWFITRPNCRHYFVSMNMKQAGKKNLAKKYHTHQKIGRLDMQSPNKSALEEYKDRLQLLLQLYNVKKSQKIKDYIIKTKLLVQKWSFKN